MLALAALLLSGCGGGSSDPASSSTGSSAASAPAGQEGGGERSSATAQAEKAAAGKAKADQSAPAAPGGDGATAQGQKHGPRIAQPKGAPEQAPTPAEVANATVADMTLESPAVPAASTEEGPGRLAATYTCDGTGSWPELRWSGVPAGSAELILYVMNVAPVEGKLFVDWAVAGLDPSLSGIEAGKLPKGAVVGTNGFGKRGYEICPSGGGEIYIFAIYALPKALSPQAGFDARELRQQVLDVSGDVGLLSAYYAKG